MNFHAKFYQCWLFVRNIFRNFVNYFDYFFWRITHWRIKPVKELKRAVIFNLRYMGDLMVTTPLLHSLKIHYGSENILVINKNMKEFAMLLPYVDKVYIYKGFKDFLDFLKTIKSDAIFILTPASYIISLVALIRGVRYRIGALSSGIIEPKGLFLTHKISHRLKHRVEQILEICKIIGIKPSSELKIRVNEDAKKRIQGILEELGVANEPFILLHPCARDMHKYKYPAYEWEKEKWGELAKELAELGYFVIFTGVKDDEEYIQSILCDIDSAKCKSLAGRINIQELVAVISQSKLLVAVDTGVIHIAVALDVPVVDLMGPTPPEIWHPWAKEDRYKVIFHQNVCNSCRSYSCRLKYNICVKSIQVDEVFKACCELLRKG